MGLGTLLVRADACPEIGTGHVMRCLALAQAWQDCGGNVVYAMANSTPAIQQRLYAENCRIVSVAGCAGTDEDAAFTFDLAQRLGAQCVVLDSYNFGSEYQHRLQNNCWTLVCLDDEGRCEYYSADIVLNQNLTADPAWYRNCRPGVQLLLGTFFCILRREFNPWREFRREVRSNACNILVTLGGNPPEKLISDIICALSSIKLEGLSTVVALGSSSTNDGSNERHAAQFPGKLVIQRNVLDMATLMKDADVAISAAGSTCWELCLLGLPTVVFDVASNQTPVALELQKRKCALYAGSGGDKLNVSGLAKTVEALLYSPELRRTLSSHSRKLVDGLGVQRVISAIQGIGCEAEFAVRAANQ